MKDKFKRSSKDRWLGGICSAIAERYEWDPLLVRIIFIFGSEILFWPYLIIWLLTDEE